MNFKKKYFLVLLLFLFMLWALIQRLKIPASNNQDLLVDGDFKSQSIFCFILTNKENFDTRTRNIYDTWAKLCDNYLFISEIPYQIKAESIILTNSQVKYKGMNILHPPDLLIDHYDKLTDKVFSTVKYLYQNYNKYDWYLKADDDTFIFVDNLRKFIQEKNKSQPVTFGYDFKVLVEHGYHSGGGGYLLSNEALLRLGSQLKNDYSFCSNSGTEGYNFIFMYLPKRIFEFIFEYFTSLDVDVGRCLRRVGVFPNKSVDTYGKERFHPLNIMAHFENVYPDWMSKYSSNPIRSVNEIFFILYSIKKSMKKMRAFYFFKGYNCCADTSISFHYMSEEDILALNKTTGNNSLNTFEKIFLEFKKLKNF